MRLSVRLHPGPPSAGNNPPGTAAPTPTPTPPHAGRLNLLLSYAGWQPDPWVERLPPLLEPMGVQSLRATTGREAQDVIRTNPIHIAVVDLGLPLDSVDSEADAPELSEGGSRLLELLHRLDQPPPTVVVKRARSTRDDHRDMAAALRLGAFAVVDRPRDQHDLNLILEVLRRCLTRFYQGRWPGGRGEGLGLRT